MSDQIKPKISVIIPCKNHARELHDCLAGCLRMQVNISFEIIVVDSATDPDVLSTASDFPKVKVFRSEENLNAASARNIGVSHAKANLFAFIDADCIPDNKWLQAAFNELNHGMQMIGGPVSDLPLFRPVAIADNALQFADLADERPEGKTYLIPGCNLGVTKEVFEKIGGFPNINTGEDSLFTSKIAALWPDKCKFVPNMRVFHKGRRSLSEFWKHNYHFGFNRGLTGFRITKNQQRLGRFRSVIPLVILKRLIYIFSSIIRWNQKKTGIYFALLPMILFGLTGYAIGFRRGCQSAFNNSD